ncbi:MAG: hypothetical protein WCF03_02415 [Nitrososphaeraceae archaeon]
MATNDNKKLSLEFVRALWNFRDAEDNTLKKTYENQVIKIGLNDGLSRAFINKKIREL